VRTLLLLASFVAAGGGRPAPVADAQLDRLLAALPESATIAADAAEEASELAHLAALNPWRGEEIKAILDAANACAHRQDRVAARVTVGAAAARLGPRKVERLIQFYGSRHYPALRALAHRAAARETLSAPEKEELRRAPSAYPVREFALAMQRATKQLVSAGRAPTYLACGADRDAAFERAALRTK
jgi:hypothetical protein